MQRYRFAGGTAIVTGAASGIGEALAHGLAARGSGLVLLDRDAERLDGVAGAIRRQWPDLSVATELVDLSDRDATERAGQRLAADHPQTTLLINNAGVALGGRFEQLTLDEFGWLFDINFRAVVTLTHHLLPVLRSHPGSHLANVSSVFGIIAPAGQSAYSSSKFAVRGFTEVLRHELAHDNIGVTCIHPGGIATRIATSARIGAGVPEAERAGGREEAARLLTIPPATAANVILAGIERRRPRVLIGWSARVPDVLARLAPASYGWLLAAAVGSRARRAARQATPAGRP
jgi:short-subunit dehydrogenase